MASTFAIPSVVSMRASMPIFPVRPVASSIWLTMASTM